MSQMHQSSLECTHKNNNNNLLSSQDSPHNENAPKRHSTATPQKQNPISRKIRNSHIQTSTINIFEETSSLDYTSTDSSINITNNRQPSITRNSSETKQNREKTTARLTSEWKKLFRQNSTPRFTKIKTAQNKRGN